MMRIIYLSLLAFLLIPLGNQCAFSSTFFWSGDPIQGQDPSYLPSGSADFSISGTTLTIILTDTTAQTLTFIGGVLSGLTWDDSSGVTLAADEALIAGGHALAGVGATGDTDLSQEWAFKDNISAGLLGSNGVGAIGDILFGVDTFGTPDKFASGNLFGAFGLNGVDASIVGPNVNFSADGFTSQGPMVQSQMVFTFDISGGTLTMSNISNVTPLFGSDGATTVPEPTSLLLLGTGLLGLVWLGGSKKKV